MLTLQVSPTVNAANGPPTQQSVVLQLLVHRNAAFTRLARNAETIQLAVGVTMGQ